MTYKSFDVRSFTKLTIIVFVVNVVGNIMFVVCSYFIKCMRMSLNSTHIKMRFTCRVIQHKKLLLIGHFRLLLFSSFIFLLSWWWWWWFDFLMQHICAHIVAIAQLLIVQKYVLNVQNELVFCLFLRRFEFFFFVFSCYFSFLSFFFVYLYQTSTHWRRDAIIKF